MPKLYHAVPRSQDKMKLHNRRSNYPWIVQYTLLDEHKLRCTVQIVLKLASMTVPPVPVLNENSGISCHEVKVKWEVPTKQSSPQGI